MLINNSLTGCVSTQVSAGDYSINLEAMRPGRYTITAEAINGLSTAKKAVAINVYENSKTEVFPEIQSMNVAKGNTDNILNLSMSTNAAIGTQYIYLLRAEWCYPT